MLREVVERCRRYWSCCLLFQNFLYTVVELVNILELIELLPILSILDKVLGKVFGIIRNCCSKMSSLLLSPGFPCLLLLGLCQSPYTLQSDSERKIHSLLLINYLYV